MARFSSRATNLTQSHASDLAQRARPKLTMDEEYRRLKFRDRLSHSRLAFALRFSPFCLFVSGDQLGYSATKPFEASQPLSATSELA